MRLEKLNDRKKADLNRRALEALGWIITQHPSIHTRGTVWKRPDDGRELYFGPEKSPDLIGNPDGTGGCWGQVIVANLLNLMPCGGEWYCMRDNWFVVGTRFGDSPGEAVARWCIEAEKAGLKPKWTVASADCGFVDPLRRTE
jgi:hypothetical protein